MYPPITYISIFFLLALLSCNVAAQVDEICAESGNVPSLDSPFAQVPYIYGKIAIKADPNVKLPNVTITYVDSQQAPYRLTIGKSGNYCFKVKNKGGSLLIEVGGVETARKSLPSFGPAQQREDFELYLEQSNKSNRPSVVSARFYYPPNPKTLELYKKTAEAVVKNAPKKAIEHLKEIVSIDSADFIAWAELGALYFSQESLTEADVAFRKCLEQKVEYTPAWINVGKLRMAQKQFEAAIEIFKHALELEPDSAKTFRLLGEAYLQAKQGTLGAEALNKAIEIDPIGMAECHLLLGHLYELARANQMAIKEYKSFLTKVPNYKDKKRLERFIEENPE